MLGPLLPLWFSIVAAPEAHAAQEQLAAELADADSVDFVRADQVRHEVVFGVQLAGERYEIGASTRDDGEVEKVTSHDRGLGHDAVGPLSWIADAMHETHAVVQLKVGEDGEVTLITDDGTRYLAIPGRHGNHDDAVEARWAAEWNS